MRNLVIAIAAVTCGCGGPGPRITVPPAVEPPPPPAYEVARSPDLGTLAADATHVYWVDQGIHRRAHGGATPAERLFVSDSYIDRIAVGTSDVFFVDDSYRLRAIPKTGGAPSELAVLQDGAWGLVPDGDGVWALAGYSLERWSREPGERKIEVPGLGVALAIAGEDAYVAIKGGDANLYRIDLTTGKATPLSNDWALFDPLGLGVAGDSVVVAARDHVLTVPRGGGTTRQGLPLPVNGFTSDDTGYVVSTGSALIAHDRGAAPRVIATSTDELGIGGAPAITIGAGYVYHVAYDQDGNDLVLRGEPRRGGTTMLRVPDGAEVQDIDSDGARVFIANRAGSDSEILELTARGPRAVASVEYVEELEVEDGKVVFLSGSVLYRIEGGVSVVRAEDDALAAPIQLHRGKVYWSEGMMLHGIAITGTAGSFVVADASAQATEDVISGHDVNLVFGFDQDHLYYVNRLTAPTSLVRVDEQRRFETLWRHDDSALGELGADLAIIGDRAFVSDGGSIFAIPLDGGGATTLYAVPDLATSYIQGMVAVGDHLVAHIRPTPGADRLVEIPLDGGAPELVWTSYLENGVLGMYVAGDRAIYMHSAELGAVLRIAVD